MPSYHWRVNTKCLAYLVAENQFESSLFDLWRFNRSKAFLFPKFIFQLEFEKVLVVTIGTDVVGLGVYFQLQMNSNIYIEYWTPPYLTYYDISLHTFDDQLVQDLSSIHTVSGSHSTSYFTEKCRYILKIFEK